MDFPEVKGVQPVSEASGDLSVSGFRSALDALTSAERYLAAARKAVKVGDWELARISAAMGREKVRSFLGLAPLPVAPTILEKPK